MIVLPEAFILQHIVNAEAKAIPALFEVLDDGDVFVFIDTPIVRRNSTRTVTGIVKFALNNIEVTEDNIFTNKGFEVVVIVKMLEAKPRVNVTLSELQFDARVKREQGQLEYCPVQITPDVHNAFSRIGGLYETAVLQSKTVLVIGLGSGGAPIAIELAKAGVGNFILIDHDRIAIENMSRHPCGISDIGRFKTKAVKDLILDKNPFASVETYEQAVDWGWMPTLQELIKRADVVFCCTDNRQSRVFVNVACVSENRTCIYGGTFRRAYGGQVLRVIPKKTMCYQCYIDTIVSDPDDTEISSSSQASAVAYSDKPVPVEPGLATDIAPIAIMCVKLGILEMLRGTNTSLKSLYEDLSSPLLQWLNRREEESDYSTLAPMDSSGDSLRILAWYGIDSEANPRCPVCGDYTGSR